MSNLAITDGLVAMVVKEVTDHGAHMRETGGFIGSTDATTTADHVLLAGRRGILRRRDLFVVSGAAIDRLFTWATEREIALQAQFHSHRRRAFLSSVDLSEGFSVEGFISSVVPGYAAPPLRPSMWGWWQFESGDWKGVGAPEVVDGGVKVLRFDEDGVHEA